MTAIPRPNAALTCFEIAKKVHIPKKSESAIFSIKTVLIKRLSKSAIRRLLLYCEGFKCVSLQWVFILLDLALTERSDNPDHNTDNDK